mmetsp:Transcript_62013/g.69437  ORF Transcript_62013/g.69437 Transcript_62013/m.69437 type:complete len:90 (+) Transcript_62013:582-851(+)
MIAGIYYDRGSTNIILYSNAHKAEVDGRPFDSSTRVQGESFPTRSVTSTCKVNESTVVLEDSVRAAAANADPRNTLGIEAGVELTNHGM